MIVDKDWFILDISMKNYWFLLEFMVSKILRFIEEKSWTVWLSMTSIRQLVSWKLNTVSSWQLLNLIWNTKTQWINLSLFLWLKASKLKKRWKLTKLLKPFKLSLKTLSMYTIWKDFHLASIVQKVINQCLLFMNSLWLSLQQSNKVIKILLKE